jgi:hypothetical protein
MSFGGPKSMRKVDGLNLIFIEFYVPLLTSRFNCTETSLQISENRSNQQRDLDKHHVFGAYHLYIITILGTGRKLVAPCLYIRWHRYFTFDWNSEFPLERKELISLIRLIENFNSDNLYSKTRVMLHQRLIPYTEKLLLKLNMTWSVNLIHWYDARWRARKPNWLALIRPLSSMCLWTIFRITFSN